MKFSILLMPFLLGKLQEKKLALCYYEKMEALFFFGGRVFSCDQACHKLIKRACQVTRKCKKALNLKKFEKKLESRSNRQLAGVIKNWTRQKCAEQN